MADRRRARPHRPRRPPRRARRTRHPHDPRSPLALPDPRPRRPPRRRSPCTPTTAATNAGDAGPATTPTAATPSTSSRTTQHATRAEAIDWLANRAGMIPDQPLPPVTRKPRPARPSVVPLDPAVDPLRPSLRTHPVDPTGGARARLAPRPRASATTTIRANHVGADPGRHMMQPPTAASPTAPSLAATFPALDPDGQVRYVQTRYLEPGDGPKYDNPAGALGTNPRLAWTRHPRVATTGRARRVRGHPRRPHRRPSRLPIRRHPRLPSPRPHRRRPHRHPRQPAPPTTSSPSSTPTPPAAHWGDHLADLLDEAGVSSSPSSSPPTASTSTPGHRSTTPGPAHTISTRPTPTRQSDRASHQPRRVPKRRPHRQTHPHHKGPPKT